MNNQGSEEGDWILDNNPNSGFENDQEVAAESSDPDSDDRAPQGQSRDIGTTGAPVPHAFGAGTSSSAQGGRGGTRPSTFTSWQQQPVPFANDFNGTGQQPAAFTGFSTSAGRWFDDQFDTGVSSDAQVWRDSAAGAFTYGAAIREGGYHSSSNFDSYTPAPSFQESASGQQLAGGGPDLKAVAPSGRRVAVSAPKHKPTDEFYRLLKRLGELLRAYRYTGAVPGTVKRIPRNSLKSENDGVFLGNTTLSREQNVGLFRKAGIDCTKGTNARRFAFRGDSRAHDPKSVEHWLTQAWNGNDKGSRIKKYLEDLVGPLGLDITNYEIFAHPTEDTLVKSVHTLVRCLVRLNSQGLHQDTQRIAIPSSWSQLFSGMPVELKPYDTRAKQWNAGMALLKDCIRYMQQAPNFKNSLSPEEQQRYNALLDSPGYPKLLRTTAVQLGLQSQATPDAAQERKQHGRGNKSSQPEGGRRGRGSSPSRSGASTPPPTFTPPTIDTDTLEYWKKVAAQLTFKPAPLNQYQLVYLRGKGQQPARGPIWEWKSIWYCEDGSGTWYSRATNKQGENWQRIASDQPAVSVLVRGIQEAANVVAGAEGILSRQEGKKTPAAQLKPVDKLQKQYWSRVNNEMKRLGSEFVIDTLKRTGEQDEYGPSFKHRHSGYTVAILSDGGAASWSYLRQGKGARNFEKVPDGIRDKVVALDNLLSRAKAKVDAEAKQVKGHGSGHERKGGDGVAPTSIPEAVLKKHGVRDLWRYIQDQAMPSARLFTYDEGADYTEWRHCSTGFKVALAVADEGNHGWLVTEANEDDCDNYEQLPQSHITARCVKELATDIMTASAALSNEAKSSAGIESKSGLGRPGPGDSGPGDSGPGASRPGGSGQRCSDGSSEGGEAKGSGIFDNISNDQTKLRQIYEARQELLQLAENIGAQLKQGETKYTTKYTIDSENDDLSLCEQAKGKFLALMNAYHAVLRNLPSVTLELNGTYQVAPNSQSGEMKDLMEAFVRAADDGIFLSNSNGETRPVQAPDIRDYLVHRLQLNTPSTSWKWVDEATRMGTNIQAWLVSCGAHSVARRVQGVGYGLQCGLDTELKQARQVKGWIDSCLTKENKPRYSALAMTESFRLLRNSVLNRNDLNEVKRCVANQGLTALDALERRTGIHRGVGG